MRKFPFTLFLLLIIGSVSIAAEIPFHDIQESMLDRFGFAVTDLARFEWYRLISSALITESPRGFFQALILVAIGVGGLEWKLGTWKAFFGFWAIHLITLLIMSALIALPISDVLWNRNALLIDRDVGPSAGYFGCFAVFLSLFSGYWRWLNLLLFVGLIFVFGFSMVYPDDNAAVLSADFAHVIAYSLGLALARRLRKI